MGLGSENARRKLKGYHLWRANERTSVIYWRLISNNRKGGQNGHKVLGNICNENN